MTTKKKEQGRGGARRGAGRPKKLDAKVYFGLRFSPSLAEWLRSSARQRKQTQTQFIESILEAAMQKKPQCNSIVSQRLENPAN